MIKKILNYLKKFMIFTTSYSINVFPEPLTTEEEEKYLKLKKEGDKEADSNTYPLSLKDSKNSMQDNLEKDVRA